MWQYLIPLVVRFLLSTVVSNLPMDEWKTAAKIWVHDTVPGKWADRAAWAVVEGAWDLILGEVLAQKPKGLAAGASMDEAWSTVSRIAADVIPKIEKKLAA